MLVPAFAASAHAQTPDIVLSNNGTQRSSTTDIESNNTYVCEHASNGMKTWYLVENGYYWNYTVKLATQPTATVTIQEVDQNGEYVPLECGRQACMKHFCKCSLIR